MIGQLDGRAARSLVTQLSIEFESYHCPGVCLDIVTLKRIVGMVSMGKVRWDGGFVTWLSSQRLHLAKDNKSFRAHIM